MAGRLKDSTAATEYLFVYGTLRPGLVTAVRQMFDRHCEYQSAGFFRGRPYDLGFCSGAVASSCPVAQLPSCPTERGHGKIFRMIRHARLLPALDRYEGWMPGSSGPRELVRKQPTGNTQTSTGPRAWVYLCNGRISRLKGIDSGKYWSWLRPDKGQRLETLR